MLQQLEDAGGAGQVKALCMRPGGGSLTAAPSFMRWPGPGREGVALQGAGTAGSHLRLAGEAPATWPAAIRRRSRPSLLAGMLGARWPRGTPSVSPAQQPRAASEDHTQTWGGHEAAWPALALLPHRCCNRAGLHSCVKVLTEEGSCQRCLSLQYGGNAQLG